MIWAHGRLIRALKETPNRARRDERHHVAEPVEQVSVVRRRRLDNLFATILQESRPRTSIYTSHVRLVYEVPSLMSNELGQVLKRAIR